MVALAFISVALFLHLPTPPAVDLKDKLRRIDARGALALITAISTLLFALDRAGTRAWSDRLVLGSLAAAAASAALFIRAERRAAEPFAPPRIVAARALLPSYAANALASASSYTLVHFLALHLQAVRARAPARVGLLMGPSVFGGVAGSLGSGLVMQATGRYWALTLGAFGAMGAGALGVVAATGAWGHSDVGAVVGASTECSYTIYSVC